MPVLLDRDTLGIRSQSSAAVTFNARRSFLGLPGDEAPEKPACFQEARLTLGSAVPYSFTLRTVALSPGSFQ